MPFIEEYDFGKIVIKGRKYYNDVIVFPEQIISSWWRKYGHKLLLEDLTEVLEYKPEILIIGTGAYGFMSVDREVIKSCRELGIKVETCRTTEAVRRFNEYLRKGRKVVAALHLTC